MYIYIYYREDVRKMCTSPSRSTTGCLVTLQEEQELYDEFKGGSLVQMF